MVTVRKHFGSMDNAASYLEIELGGQLVVWECDFPRARAGLWSGVSSAFVSFCASVISLCFTLLLLFLLDFDCRRFAGFVR